MSERYYIVWNESKTVGCVTKNGVVANNLSRGFVNLAIDSKPDELECLASFANATEGDKLTIEVIE